MGSRSATALRNFLAAIYAITVVIVGAIALWYTSVMFQSVSDHFRPPQPDVIQFLQGDWQ